MSTYDDASLVMIPSGYKTGTVFSQKPMSTDGQLTFTRSNDTATRVASNGLIEKVRTNLNPNGNLVGLALNTNPTGYANFNTGTFEPVTNTTSEVGTFCKFTTSATRSFLERTFTGLTIGQAYAFSYKVQAVSGGLLANQSFSFFSGVTLSSFYINGVSSPTGSDSVTTGLIYIVGVATSTSISIRIGSGVSGATTAVLEIGNFQLESSDIATDYIPTTTAAVSVGPVANVPRLDYLGSTCPRLLLEPQRTNLITFSEQFDNAAWTQGRLATTANTQASPSGTISADTITDTVTSGTHRIYTTGDISVVSGTSYAASCFVKAGTSNRVEIRVMSITESDIGITGTVFNLSNGTIVSGSGSIQNYGNGWYRCTNTGTSNTTGNAKQFIYLYNSTNQKSYLGTATNTLFIWGAQVETGAYATSYIPTLAASVTRGADSGCNKTGISPLIGQTEGTLFVEVDLTLGRNNTGAGNGMFEVLDSGRANAVTILKSAAVNQIILALRVNSVNTFISAGAYISGTNKIAFAYKSGQNVCYVNGVLAATNSLSFTFSASVDAVNVGAYTTNVIDDRLSQALLFKTRLDNATLASLTTL